jgi:hypothetical protein
LGRWIYKRRKWTIHNIDPATKEIQFEVNPGEVERININDVLEVMVLDLAVVEISNNISFIFWRILLESHETGGV